MQRTIIGLTILLTLFFVIYNNISWYKMSQYTYDGFRLIDYHFDSDITYKSYLTVNKYIDKKLVEFTELNDKKIIKKKLNINALTKQYIELSETIIFNTKLYYENGISDENIYFVLLFLKTVIDDFSEEIRTFIYSKNLTIILTNETLYCKDLKPKIAYFDCNQMVMRICGIQAHKESIREIIVHEILHVLHNTEFIKRNNKRILLLSHKLYQKSDKYISKLLRTGNGYFSTSSFEMLAESCSCYYTDEFCRLPVEWSNFCKNEIFSHS